MPTLDTIRVHPIKSLDPIELTSCTIENGGLQYDRAYAMFDEDGAYVNGKNYKKVHKLRMDFERDTEIITLQQQNADQAHRFDLATERGELEDWLSDFFETEISVLDASDTRFTDAAGGSAPMEITAPGPSIVSTATYREVASWFPELDINDVRDRFRTNLEVAGVSPFWEDLLFSDKDHVVEFRIGDVLCRGILPLPRCVVPTRDPRTGERDKDFVDVFTTNREEKFPEWANEAYLGEHLPNHSNHYFYLTVVTRIPNSENGKTINVGDDIEILDTKEVIKTL